MMQATRRAIARLASTAAVVLAACAAAPPAAPAFDWPGTPAGGTTRAFFDAYAAGDDALATFFSTRVSAADLAERPLEARLARWRDLRARFGALTPLRVIESAPARIELAVRPERTDAGETIALGVDLHEEAPHTLVGLSVEVSSDVGGGGAPPPPLTGPPPTDEAIVARLAAELDSLARAGRFSGTALLDKDGLTLFSRSYGMASREAARPNALDTRFNIASIGKQFTMVAIRQLAAAGKLSLDDPVTEHLPDYRVANAERVTIAMLLEHKGGVPDVFDHEATWEHPGRLRTAADWYGLVRDRPLLFEPGARQRYSNGGYVVLGMIVERVSGEDYYAYLKRHVFDPAGMTRTACDLPDAKATDVATGYTRDPDGRGPHGPAGVAEAGAEQPIAEGFGRASAAGGTFSTAPDLVRYARALRAGRLLGREATEALTGPRGGLGVAGGAPGKNALLEVHGPYALAIVANVDPPAAERFAETVGRMIQHAARGAHGGETERVRVGGGAR